MNTLPLPCRRWVAAMLVVLAGLAPSRAGAALITITTNDELLGSFSGDISGLGVGAGLGVLPIDEHFELPFASARGPDDKHYFTGKVIADNFGGTRFRLVLTDFEYTGASDCNQQLDQCLVTVRIRQNYEMAFSPAKAKATHSFEGYGSIGGGTGAFVAIDLASTHEGVRLPALSDTGGDDVIPDAFPFRVELSDGPEGALVDPANDPYFIDTTYDFVWKIGQAAGAGPVPMSIFLPGSGVSEGRLLPAPATVSLMAPALLLLLASRRRPVVRRVTGDVSGMAPATMARG